MVGECTSVIVGPTMPSDLRPLLQLFSQHGAGPLRCPFHGSLTHFPRRYLIAVICGEDGVIGRVARDVSADRSGGPVVGFATATPESATDVELAVWVEESYRRRGIATRLIRSLAEQALLNGYRNVTADIDTGNAAATALARSLATRCDLGAAHGHVTRPAS